MSVQEIKRLWPIHDTLYWCGKYSEFKHGAAIETFIQEWLQQNNPKWPFAIPALDGFVTHPQDLDKDQTGIRVLDFSSNDPKRADYEALKKQGTVFGILCTRNYKCRNLLYLPLDDDTFQKGLPAVLPPLPPWHTRKATAFWRGGFSGHPFIRGDVVKALLKEPNTDVKLIARWQWNHPVPQDHLGQEASTEVYLQHKYILIIDGGLIASSHQWVLGSGAVPIFVTHPDNHWWCKEWLIDGYNCIMSGYDLNLLKQKIQWLVANDEKAELIAKQAKATADRIFTPEFQKAYLNQELQRLLC
jgi:hypothetical protein